MKNEFSAIIEIIGINPYVLVPDEILQELFRQSGLHKGKIPVRMKIDGHAFIQTLVKYAGHWRLYINGPMRKAAGKDVGDAAKFQVSYDPVERKLEPHPDLLQALELNPRAKEIFEGLSPSLRLEIVRYISFLKTPESIARNVDKAINFLLGKGNFIGREKPR